MLDLQTILTHVADDTSRSYKERDMARILELSALLLLNGEYQKAVDNLNYYINDIKISEELEKIIGKKVAS